MTYQWEGGHYCDYFFVGLNRDGSIRPLKIVQPKEYRAGKSIFTRLEWSYGVAELVAKDHKRPVEEWMREMFALVANRSMSRDSGMTVKVRKNGLCAAFAIDMERTPYFFADREKTVTENGQTKKIIHIVRAHERTLAGGHKKWIRSHFRGLREFTWNGYEVSVGLGGKHGASLGAINLEPTDDDDGDVIGMEEAGKKLGQAIV